MRCSAPQLVPLFTLSIPGSPTVAVLLGGLLIHGLFSGTDLFTIHGGVTWTFVNSLLVAQGLMLIIGLIVSRHSGWIIKVPGHYMAAVILLLAVFAVLLSVMFTVAVFWNTDADVYFFPRIVSGFMLLLALVQWVGVIIKTFKDKKPVDTPAASQFAWSALLPRLMVGTGYVLIIKRLGFYTSSLLAFVIITLIYGKCKALDIRALSYKIIVGLIFVAILYALFWKLLNVRIPIGVLF